MKTQTPSIVAHDLSSLAPGNLWLDLEVPPEELRCSLTLTTGQSFSWTPVTTTDQTSSALITTSAWGSLSCSMWVGVIDVNVILMEEMHNSTRARLLHPQSPDFPLKKLLNDYFQLEIPLLPLYKSWTASSPILFPPTLLSTLPGVRVLNQPPVETLIAFLTSSNNNIPRIKALLETLRKNHGELLVTTGLGIAFKSFPTLAVLQTLTDEDWRSMGFGYRAKFFLTTINLLLSPETPLSLPDLKPTAPTVDNVSPEEATIKSLLQLSGVGRKVADCIALFALGQADVVPVDTHVYQIAARVDPSIVDLATPTPKKRKKPDTPVAEQSKPLPPSSPQSMPPSPQSMPPASQGMPPASPLPPSSPPSSPREKDKKPTISDRVYKRVQEVFKVAFPGGYAGWAHSVLFVMELPSFKAAVKTANELKPAVFETTSISDLASI